MMMKKTASGLCSFPGCGVERHGNGATCYSHGVVLEQSLSESLQQSLQVHRHRLPVYATNQGPLAMGIPVYNAVRARTDGQHVTGVHTRPSLQSVQKNLSQFLNHGPQLHQPILPGEHSSSEVGLNITGHTPNILEHNLTADNVRPHAASAYPPNGQMTEAAVRNLAMFRLSPYHQGRGSTTAVHMQRHQIGRREPLATNLQASKSVKSWHSPQISVTSASGSLAVGKGPPSRHSMAEQQTQPRHSVDQTEQSTVQSGNISDQGVGETMPFWDMSHQSLDQDVNQPEHSVGQLGHNFDQQSQSLGQPNLDVSQPRRMSSKSRYNVDQSGNIISQSVQDMSKLQQIISQRISEKTHSHNIQAVGMQQINETVCHRSSPNDVACHHDTSHMLNGNTVSMMVSSECQGSAAQIHQQLSVQPLSDKCLVKRKSVDEEDVIIVEMDDDVLFTKRDPPSEKLAKHYCSRLKNNKTEEEEHRPTSTFQTSETVAAVNDAEEANSDEDCIVLDFSENDPPSIFASSLNCSQESLSEKFGDNRKTSTNSFKALEGVVNIKPIQSNNSPTKFIDSQSQSSKNIKVLEAVSLSEKANYSILQASEAKAFSVLSAESYYRCGCSGGQCGFRTVLPVLLELHLQEAHPSEKAYPCVHCGHREEGQESLLRHLEQHLSMQTLSLCCCEIGCDFKSFSAKEVIYHMEIYHKDLVKFICWCCSSHFDSLQSFTDHVKQNLLILFRCALCSAKDVDRQALFTHITSSHPDCGRLVGIQQVLLCKERNANDWGTFENSSSVPSLQPHLVDLSGQEKQLARSVYSLDQHSCVQNAPANTVTDVSHLTTNTLVSSVMQEGSETTREVLICEHGTTAHEVQPKLQEKQLENRMNVSELGSQNTDSLHGERMSITIDLTGAPQSTEACVGTENLTHEHSRTGYEDADESTGQDLGTTAIPDDKLKETGVKGTAPRNWVKDCGDTEETDCWLKKTCSWNVADKYANVVCKICNIVSKCLEDHVNHVYSIHREQFEGFACQHCSFISVDRYDHSKHQCAPKRHLRSRSGVGCLNEDFLSLISPLRSAVKNSTSSKIRQRSSINKARKNIGTTDMNKMTVAKQRNAFGSLRKGCKGRGKRLPGRVLCNLCGLSGTSFTHMQLHLYKEHSTVMACPYCYAKPVNDRLMFRHFMEHHPNCLNQFELVKSQNFISSITSGNATETDHTIVQKSILTNVNGSDGSAVNTTLEVKQVPDACKHIGEASEEEVVESQELPDDNENGQSDTALKDAVKLETQLSLQNDKLKDSMEIQTSLTCDNYSEATSDTATDLVLNLSDNFGSTEEQATEKGLPHCKLCNFCSSRLSQLRSHVYKHHKEVMKCPRCEVHPANDRHFYRHLSNFHREERVLLFNHHKSINWIKFPVGYKRGKPKLQGQSVKHAQMRDHSIESGTEKCPKQFCEKARLSVSPQTFEMQSSSSGLQGTNTSCRQPNFCRNNKMSSIGNATPARKRSERSVHDCGISLSPGKKKRASQRGLFECTLCSFSSRYRGSSYRHIFAKHREVVQCSVCNTSDIDSASQLKKHVYECHQEQKDLYKKLAPSNWLRFFPGEKKRKNLSATSKENPGSPQVDVVLHTGIDSIKDNTVYDPNGKATPNPDVTTTSGSVNTAVQSNGHKTNVSRMSGSAAAQKSCILNLKREAEAASSSFISKVLQWKMMPISEEEVFEYRCPHCTSDFKQPHRFYEHLSYHYHYRCFKCGYCSHLAFAASAVFNHSKKAHPEQEPDIQHLKKVTFENRIQRVMQNNHVHVTAPYTERRLLAYERARMRKDMKKNGKNASSNLLPRKLTKIVDQNHPSLKIKLKVKLGKKAASKARKIVKKIKVKKAGIPSEAASGGEKWLQCPYCRAEKKTQKIIEREIRYHIHYKPFRCPYCDVCSGSESFIPRHIEKTHPNKIVSVAYERIEQKEHRFRLLFERSLAMAGSVIKDLKMEDSDHIHDEILETANLVGSEVEVNTTIMKNDQPGDRPASVPSEVVENANQALVTQL